MKRHSATICLSAGLLAGSVFPLAAADPVYFSQAWEHRADGLNLIRIPDGPELAVADDGSHLVDSSLLAELEANPLRFDTLNRFAGRYYFAHNRGNREFDWVFAGDGDGFVSSESLAESAENPHFTTHAFLPDPDPVRGDLGAAVFPEAGMALMCGRLFASDTRISDLFPFSEDGNPESFGGDDETHLPMQSPFVSSVRAEDLPDRVVLHADGGGFWYLGTMLAGGPNMLALGHARPERTEDGGRSVNLTQIVAVSDDARHERFETAAVVGDDLLLLLAWEDHDIGGYRAARRLLRVSPEDGVTAEFRVVFDHHLASVRAAAVGDDQLLLHSPDEATLIDATTLEPVWRKSLEDILDGNPQGHRISRAAADASGGLIALAFDTPLRRPDEPNRVVAMKPDGSIEWSSEARPAPVDLLRFSTGGGLLLYTSDYTALFGGDPSAVENEDAAIVRAAEAHVPEATGTAAVPPTEFTGVPREKRHRLWFDKPAPGHGRQSLPVGNGHLGAMFTGGIDEETVTFNVDSLWQGDDRDMGQYQTFGVIRVALGHEPEDADNYRRELDLRTGLHTVTYQYDGVTHTREAFASYPHGLLGIRLTADRPGALSGVIELQAMHFAEFTKDEDGIDFSGVLPNDRTFQASMRVQTRGGEVLPDQGESGTRTLALPRRINPMPYDSIVVEDADEIVIYLAADTDYAFDPENDFLGDPPAEKIAPRLEHAERLGFEEMRDVSTADVAALFDRCTLEVAVPDPSVDDLPIDQRRAAYRDGAADPGLEVLVFDAVRHMMIASSRPGSLPANLQGIWNDSNWPAWTSDYHADINLQMAYWHADPTNLAECNAPLFEYIESQIPHRRRSAREVFGEDVRGWTVDYMNGIFGAGGYLNYPPGAAWYAWHFADHFKYSQDTGFLEEHAYPVLRELCEHWQDILIERPDGTLTTPRTISPEHKPLQFGISHDVQLVHSLFTDFIAASRRLGRDEEFRAEVEAMRDRLPPMKIGRWGQFQEWEVDRDSRYSIHRHINHMFPAFPGNRITREQAPELADAVVTGLEARGIGGTGWSKVWRMPIFARLGEPVLLERQMHAALGDFHDHLIWQSHSQIDAPAGFAAGICEALLQSHETLAEDDSRFVIHLLPAPPPSWRHGRLRGMRARGGYEVDIDWHDGLLTSATIRNISSPVDEVRVRHGEEMTTIRVERGGEHVMEFP